MGKRLTNCLHYILIFFIPSCITNAKQFSIQKIPQLNNIYIKWDNCITYDDSLVLNIDSLDINKIPNKYSSIFYKKILVKENCNKCITYGGKVLNGIFKIVNINRPILGETIITYYRPDYIIAKFKNGKRVGKWYYFPMETFYISQKNTVKALFPNLKYKPTLQPLKLETYKKGFPHGKWWQKSINKIEFFIYKNGKYKRGKMKIIK